MRIELNNENNKRLSHNNVVLVDMVCPNRGHIKIESICKADELRYKKISNQISLTNAYVNLQSDGIYLCFGSSSAYNVFIEIISLSKPNLNNEDIIINNDIFYILNNIEIDGLRYNMYIVKNTKKKLDNKSNNIMRETVIKLEQEGTIRLKNKEYYYKTIQNLNNTDELIWLVEHKSTFFRYPKIEIDGFYYILGDSWIDQKTQKRFFKINEETGKFRIMVINKNQFEENDYNNNVYQHYTKYFIINHKQKKKLLKKISIVDILYSAENVNTLLEKLNTLSNVEKNGKLQIEPVLKYNKTSGYYTTLKASIEI